MLEIPEMNEVDLTFGNIKHMPKYDSLPEEFQDWHHHPFCRAVSHWFMKGASSNLHGLLIGDTKYTAKPGIDRVKALAAIKAILSSWSPKHEHKIAACGYMLHEWFDASPVSGKERA